MYSRKINTRFAYVKKYKQNNPEPFNFIASLDEICLTLSELRSRGWLRGFNQNPGSGNGSQDRFKKHKDSSDEEGCKNKLSSNFVVPNFCIFQPFTIGSADCGRDK